ncbi:MAG: M20 metallopeptidase family protein [Longimicrobiales bacterium]
MHELLQKANVFADQLVALRRDLHRHPELSFQELRTAGLVAEQLRASGWRVRTGVGRTGLVAELGTGTPLVALRADMDALPMQERSDHDYASQVPGVMHACGHDAHVSMLLGAALVLVQADQTSPLRGTVRLLFQPSEEAADEENKSGATRMIEDGAMQDVSAVFGLHVGAHLENGKAFIRAGPYMAGTDTFAIRVEGRSAHAARPHEGVDAVVLAAHLVLACQNIVARRISPLQSAVLSIGTVNGGVAENVIAETVTLKGTLRYYDDAVRRMLHHELRSALAVATALGGRATLDLRPGYPAVVNDEHVTSLARTAAQQVLGPDAIAHYEPMMTAEDFSFLARQAPGCFFWLGAALEPAREHHQPNFDIDESILPRGAALLAACALQFLEEHAR